MMNFTGAPEALYRKISPRRSSGFMPFLPNLKSRSNSSRTVRHPAAFPSSGSTASARRVQSRFGSAIRREPGVSALYRKLTAVHFFRAAAAASNRVKAAGDSLPAGAASSIRV